MHQFGQNDKNRFISSTKQQLIKKFWEDPSYLFSNSFYKPNRVLESIKSSNTSHTILSESMESLKKFENINESIKEKNLEIKEAVIEESYPNFPKYLLPMSQQSTREKIYYPPPRSQQTNREPRQFCGCYFCINRIHGTNCACQKCRPDIYTNIKIKSIPRKSVNNSNDLKQEKVASNQIQSEKSLYNVPPSISEFSKIIKRQNCSAFSLNKPVEVIRFHFI